jgi:asparagine synthase (glutamine-hydrolysing)
MYLQRWLARQDLTGMANSVEVRVPFLGRDLAVQANKLSMKFKRGNGQSKWIIKKLLSDRYSTEFVERKKVGFDFPLNDWIDNEHINFLQGRSDLFDRSRLNAILRKHEGTYLKYRIVFSLVAFATWHDSMNR